MAWLRAGAPGTTKSRRQRFAALRTATRAEMRSSNGKQGSSTTLHSPLGRQRRPRGDAGLRAKSRTMPGPDLVADCGRCAALCCIAIPFDAGEDFAFTKAADERCRHLTRDARCAIHERRGDLGFSGCAIYDCHGAGQRATRAFATQPDSDLERNEAFFALRRCSSCSGCSVKRSNSARPANLGCARV